VIEQLELHNLRTDHVMIRSELKHLIGGNVVMLKCRVFGGKTGPFPMGRVFRVVRRGATVRFQVEPEPEPTREFGPIGITRYELISSQVSTNRFVSPRARESALSYTHRVNNALTISATDTTPNLTTLFWSQIYSNLQLSWCCHIFNSEYPAPLRTYVLSLSRPDQDGVVEPRFESFTAIRLAEL